MRKLQLCLTFFSVFVCTAFSYAQNNVVIEGYVFEEYNRGFLNEVKITVLERSGVLLGEVQSDTVGHFSYPVEANKTYVLQYEKKIFQTSYDTISTTGKKAGEKLFVKHQLERQPGYLLEVTLAEKRSSEEIPVDAVNGARIEIYNKTMNRDELVIDSAKSPIFSHTLQQGNHYILMVRRKNFFTKRLEMRVNVEGCYLCMEGFGTVKPGVVSNLTAAENFALGTLIANVELEPIDTNRSIALRNIYYGYNSAELTEEAQKELDKVVDVLRNNQQLIVELGSHTDARGADEYNKTLSQARAQSAVDYIIGRSYGFVDNNRLKAKGYGETQIANRCTNGVPCSEQEHLENRRTELRIVGITKDRYEGKTLGEIVREEELTRFVLSGESEKVYVGANAPTEGNANSGQKMAQNPPPPPPSVSEEKVKPKELPKEVQNPKVIKPNGDVIVTPKQANAPKVVPNVPENADILIKLDSISSFSGYTVQAFVSKTALKTSDKVIKELAINASSEIKYQRLTNGSYSIMVGKFQAWSEAERYLEKVKEKYPEAIIIDYYNGKRLSDE